MEAQLPSAPLAQEPVVTFDPPGSQGSAVPGAQPRHLAFRFTGRGGEYFRIWIVNLALTILSLGIYSAWAKVRRLRYFHGCLHLDGVPFQYTGNPVAILKGRLIAYGVLALYAALGHFYPLAQGLAGLALAGLVPLAIVKALRFHAANTLYLGLRFDFRGGYFPALRAFVLWMIVVPFTLGLLYPFVVARQKAFVVNHHAFGRTPFALEAPVREFYRVFGVAALIVVLMGVVGGVLASGGTGAGAHPALLMWALLPVFGLLMAAAYARVQLANLVIGHTRLGPHRFHAQLRFWPLLWIYASNLLLVMLTLGLYIPWARVRTLAYQAGCVSLELQGDPAALLAAEAHAPGAAGGEFAEALDIDLGL